MSDARFAWLLNLDAELELAAGPSYTPRRNVEDAMLAQREKSRWLTDSDSSFFPREFESESPVVRALLPWCPTWSSRRLAERAGAKHLALASPEILRLVSDKAFVVHSGAFGPAERRLATSRSELDSSILDARSRGKRLRVKRRFGAQGRGQRALRDPLGASDEKFLEDGFRAGGFLVEPELDAPRELSLHGMLLGDDVVYGKPCALAVDTHGSVTSIAKALDADSETERALTSLADPVAKALARAGYAGPFGIDFLEAEGERFVSDINPRFTLGWSIGFAERRSSALERFVEACEKA